MVDEVDHVVEGEEDLMIDGVNPTFLMSAFNLDNIDIAKIDIEGAELDVFNESLTNSLEWIAKTALLTVELHPHYRAGADEMVNGAMKRFNYSKAASGEHVYWVDEKKLESIKLV